MSEQAVQTEKHFHTTLQSAAAVPPNVGRDLAEMRERVAAARERQTARGFLNAHIPARVLRRVSALDEAGERILEMAVRRLGLSARAHDRVLKVARIIADLYASERILAKHLAEAVQYRSLDRSY